MTDTKTRSVPPCGKEGSTVFKQTILKGSNISLSRQSESRKTASQSIGYSPSEKRDIAP